MLRLIRNIALITNIVCALLLIAIKVGSYLPPSEVWPLPLISIAYPLILLANFAFVIYWIVGKRRKRVFISVVGILIGWSQLTSIYQLVEIFGTDNNDYKIMTYNVRSFSYYDWHNNRVIKNNIIDLVNQEQPDIICFQEYTHHQRVPKKFNTTDTITEILNTDQYFIKKHKCDGDGMCYCISTFSKFPIVNTGSMDFENTVNTFIYTDVIINEDTIRVYNCHLESYRLMNHELSSVNSIKANKEAIKTPWKYKQIYLKLRRAFYNREIQTKALYDHIRKCKYQVFVCGDFNDVPTSYTYTKVRSSQNLSDAFIESGKQFAGTYKGKLPSFRIDYILYSDEIKTSNYRVRREELSDHYPSICNFSIDK